MRSVYLPPNLDELWQCFAENPEALVYAGGTDVLVNMRNGIVNPQTLICLERIGKLKGITESPTHVRVGACSTLSHLLEHSLINKHYPVLIKALQTLGSPLIRQMGTIGGNICNASPAGDTLPPLYVLQAEIEIKSSQSSRIISISEFISGPRQTQLREGEIVSAVILKKGQDFNVQHFEKVGLRKALACSVVSMAALLKLSDEGIVKNAYLAWGSIGPTVVTSDACEKFLIGKKLTRETLEVAASNISQEATPIDDVRAEDAYRKTVAGNLLLRLTI